MSEKANQYERDTLIRLRAEARMFRDYVAMKRKEISELKGRPMSRRDPVALLIAQGRLTEYLRSAQDREAAAKEIRDSLRASLPA